MRKIVLCTAAAAAFAVAGCATAPEGTAGASGSASASAAADLTPEAGPAYVTMAAASDLYEIESSRLALTKSQNAAIRQFAQMMIDHHTQTTQQLTAAARTAGITPAPRLLPMQEQMIARLQQADAAGFDVLYTGQQLQAHQMALDLHGNFAARGDVPALRTVAAAAVPIVTQHLAQARTFPN